MSVPRRDFLKLAALGVVGATLVESSAASEALAADRRNHIYRSAQKAGIKLGVASYSLRNFPRDKAIEMTKSLGVRYLNFKSMHLPYEASPAEIALARQQLAAAGLELVGGGMITFETDTDDEIGRASCRERV